MAAVRFAYFFGFTPTLDIEPFNLYMNQISGMVISTSLPSFALLAIPSIIA